MHAIAVSGASRFAGRWSGWRVVGAICLTFAGWSAIQFAASDGDLKRDATTPLLTSCRNVAPVRKMLDRYFPRYYGTVGFVAPVLHATVPQASRQRWGISIADAVMRINVEC